MQNEELSPAEVLRTSYFELEKLVQLTHFLRDKSKLF